MSWLSWDHLFVCKELGGMGFHNLYGFNLVMLGETMLEIIF